MRNETRYYLAALLITIIFFVDLATPVGFVSWLLYLLPIMLVAVTLNRPATYLVTALCTVLMMVGLFLSPVAGISFKYGVLNSLMGVFIFWLTALFYVKHLQTRQSYRQSEDKFRMITETIKEVFWMADMSGNRILYISPEFERIWGADREDLYRNVNLFRDSLHPQDRDHVLATLQAIRTHQPFSHECRIIRRDGDVRWIWNQGFPVPGEGEQAGLYVGVVQDITQRKMLESQLLHAQKMESIGVLAGGIAHDFNNILTAITGYGNIVREKLPEDSPVLSYIDQLLLASERGSNLTRSLLAFSRKQVIHPKFVNINDIVTGVHDLLRRVIGEDIALTVNADQRDLIILADPTQVEQVLMNLATNARDAMLRGGTLTLTTSAVTMDSPFIARHGFGRQGTFALLRIVDTGQGIDREAQSKIFEPFFTTKDQGKGTGLGLSIVYGIVKQHQGYITVDSEEGKGTTFRIYFPLVEQLPSRISAGKKAAAPAGSETVLLAEDDREVRTLLAGLLVESGYRVLCCSDGEQAVSRFREHRDAIDLLILDVIMPKKNGVDAFEEMRAMKPGLKALFMSGYPGDHFERLNIPIQDLNLLAKPVAPTDFLVRVREILNG